MQIDALTREGVAFAALARELHLRQWRLERLNAYYKGEPPLPEGMRGMRDVAYDFFKTSRTNFAELVAEAPRERMRPTGIRTAAPESQDDDGDAGAWAVWVAAGLPILSADVHQSMLSLGDGYVIVSWDKTAQRAVVTAEDPLQVVTLHDPMTDAVTSALKLYRDYEAKLDVAYMYLPGQVFVATRRASDVSALSLAGFNSVDWEWDTDRSGPLPDGFDDVIPVVRFRNRGGVSEFERHIDVLDRINRTVLRGMVIMTYQAFRQRAFKGEFPDNDPATGEPIDWLSQLKSGPDSVWLLPPAAEIWESGQVDLTPLMGFVKNDVLFLAAVTRTPLAMLTPDAANQSAEGAALQREGLVFKTEDRIDRASASWARVVSLMFRFSGDAARSTVESIALIWAPVERYSVTERASAIAQTKGVISRYQQLTEIWGMSPEQANRALSELTDDLVLDQQYAIGLKAATGMTNSVTNNNAG